MSLQIKKRSLASGVVDYFDNQIDSVDAKVNQEILDRQAAITAAESLVSAEESRAEAAELALGSRIDSVISNTDPAALDSLSEIVSAFEAADSNLNGAITALGTAASSALGIEVARAEAAEAALASADTTNLQSAKDYTDAQIATIPAGDLSGYYTKPEVDTKESALDLRIDALEAFGPDQTVHVSKNGSDSNSGKQHAPFLTITAALNSISDSAPTKRYVVKVSSGADSEAIALKANVFVVGYGQKEAVRITGAVSLDSSFSGSGDHRSGFSEVMLLSACDFNWQTVTSAAGKLYFNEVSFSSTINMYGHNNATAQAQFNDCVMFGNLTVSGINVGVFTNNVCFGNITLNQHPNGGMATVLNATGGSCSGTVSMITTVNDFNRRCGLFAKSFFMNAVVINGASSYADVTDSSIPAAGPTISNGGNIVYMNAGGANKTLSNLSFPTAVNQPLMPATTSATNFGDWNKQWAWTFSYVHASSGSDAYLISYGSSFGADSVGRNVGIIADGAGLQANVNGGNIDLGTAAVSGTGVRGKITLDAREIDVTSKQIKNLANGSASTDAVNKSQLDSAESGLQSQINTEKGRVDAILLAADADKDSFAEIVSLINSVDTENDTAFAGYVLSNDAAVSALDVRLDTAEPKISTLESKVSALEAKGFSKGSQVVGAELGYIDLDRTYATILSMSVGRLAVHEGEDYTTSVIGGVTRITWIGSLLNPSGSEKIETGDKVFWSGAY